MAEDDRAPITLELTRTQIRHVLAAAAENGTPSVFGLLAGGDVSPRTLLGDPENARLSHSLLCGLALLVRFDVGGEERGINEVANELDMSPSSAHRFASTLRAAGLLERNPQTRKYRVASQWRDEPDG